MNAILGLNYQYYFNETDYERRRLLKLEKLRLRCKNIFRLPDIEFFRLFRMHKNTFAELMHLLTPHLRDRQRSDGISLELKVAATVRFLAQGSYQLSVGRDLNFGMSQPTVSKTMKAILLTINQVLCPRFIRFPTTDVEKAEIQTWYDGTQIGIYPPCIQNFQSVEHLYVNRKNFHAINVQVIVDHEYRILNVNAKFPGSAHDSHIWRMSIIREHLQNMYRHQHEWILGDSGYPLEPWLITPIDNPQTQDDMMFNNLHAKARNTVERAIGLLKSRWRCLCKQRMLHYSPTVARRIINACAGLHNFCAFHDDIFDEPLDPVDDNDDNNDNVVYGAHAALSDIGAENRQEIIQFMRQYV